MTSIARLRRLVGNPDAYAVQHKDGTWHPVREELVDGVLQAHLDKTLTIGTYVNVKDHAHLLVFDIDVDDTDLAAAVVTSLRELGIRAPGTEFSGRKGYHVWVVFQDEVLAHDLRRIGRHVLAMAGLPANTEVFPKQDEVKDLGNLVKLPAGIHQVTGAENPMLGDAWPRAVPVAVLRRILEDLPEEVHAKRGVSEERFPCMAAIQEEGCIQGSRNIQLYHLAAMLRRAGVSTENTWAILERSNGLGEPVDEQELVAIFDSAAAGGPICSQLPEERQCGELCIMERTKGLYTRPQQLRHAGVGENVVVTVAARKGNVVEFEHDDVGKMKGVLRGH